MGNNKIYNKNKDKSIKICIIGAGKVGTTMAYILTRKNIKNLKITSVSSRSDNSINRAKKILGELSGNIHFTKNNIDAVINSNCIMITTPDDLIGKVCKEIFEYKNLPEKKYIVLHFSGSKSLDVLKDAKKKGASTGSIHPIKSFASIDEAIETISHTVFGITYSDNSAKTIIEKIIKNVDGDIIEVEDKKKPLYHASACAASNYLVSLLNYAVSINEKIGIDANKSLKGLLSLTEGTINNIRKLGTRKALTGPIARGDIGTIEEHLINFKKYFKKEDIMVYKVMGIETAKIAYQNGWIDEKKYKSLLELLKI